MNPVKQPLRVLFLLQRPEALGNIASIWRTMQLDPAFQPIAWLLPYNAENMALSNQIKPKHQELLKSQGLPWVNWEPDLHLKANQFDVAIFTHPYDSERPRALWFDQVRSCVSKIVYVPYGLSVGAGTKNLRLQFSQPLHIGADLIIARSFAEKKMYSQYCPKGSNNVQVLGHPRFDRLLQELDAVNTQDLKARIGNRIAILWSSHFSFTHRFSQSSNFSSFDLLGPELLEYFLAHRRTLCLLWRPHPGLFPELVSQRLLTLEQITVLRTELDELGIVLDEQADHLPAFACSQALMSDPGSFLFEYLATGKPLLPLINPEGEPLNEEASYLVSACGAASSFYEVEKFITAISSNSISRALYLALRDQHLPLLDGYAGIRICSAILEKTIPTLDSIRVNYTKIKQSNRPPIFEYKETSIRIENTPPVLKLMLAVLRKIRMQKAAQSRWRKWTNKEFNRARTILGERIKQNPWLMQLAKRILSLGDKP